MDTLLNYNEVVRATEEAIKNTSSKQYFIPDTFNYKITKEFMLALALSTKNAKEISVVYWFMKSMNKANIVYNVNNKKVYTAASLSKVIYYRLIKRLLENDFILKINSKTFMVNPNFVINHRKSINRERTQLLELWDEYVRQTAKELL
jgi:hypothetical protein